VEKTSHKTRELKVALLLFAAGGSSRLGRPKQLVVIDQKFLLQRIIDQVIDDQYDIYLVTGAYRNQILSKINLFSVEEIYNDAWDRGFGHSISRAVQHINKKSNYSAVIISVTDQVHLSKDKIKQLIQSWNSGPKDIVVSDYGREKGPPVLFPKDYFESLIALDGDVGAKNIIKDNSGYVRYVPFPKGKIDIDTQKDIDELNSK
jgi:molybdenum cofactor cytidylyltransferase